MQKTLLTFICIPTQCRHVQEKIVTLSFCPLCKYLELVLYVIYYIFRPLFWMKEKNGWHPGQLKFNLTHILKSLLSSRDKGWDFRWRKWLSRPGWVNFHSPPPPKKKTKKNKTQLIVLTIWLFKEWKFLPVGLHPPSLTLTSFLLAVSLALCLFSSFSVTPSLLTLCLSLSGWFLPLSWCSL